MLFRSGEDARYFGRPEDFADLYGFVRNNAGLFDGYEEAVVLGPDMSVPEGLAARPVTLPKDRQVYAFLRARPGDAAAPVAVHLVDWSDTPAPVEVLLRPIPFFGEGPLAVTLHTPGAEEKLPVQPLGEDRVRVTVPPLRPWGILAVGAGG